MDLREVYRCWWAAEQMKRAMMDWVATFTPRRKTIIEIIEERLAEEADVPTIVTGTNA